MNRTKILPAMRFSLAVVAFCFAAVAAVWAEENIMIQEDNMKGLNRSLPNERFRLLGSNAPGQVFVGDEQVDLKVAFKRGSLAGKVPFSLEIQEVGTRTPGKVAGGWRDGQIRRGKRRSST